MLGGVCAYFGPWWIISPVCFVCCMVRSRKPIVAFWTSALAGATLWGGYALYLHLGAKVDLTTRVMGIFTSGTPALAGVPALALMLTITVFIAGLLSGVSGLAGARVGQLIRTRHR